MGPVHGPAELGTKEPEGTSFHPWEGGLETTNATGDASELSDDATAGSGGEEQGRGYHWGISWRSAHQSGVTLPQEERQEDEIFNQERASCPIEHDERSGNDSKRPSCGAFYKRNPSALGLILRLTGSSFENQYSSHSRFHCCQKIHFNYQEKWSLGSISSIR